MPEVADLGAGSFQRSFGSSAPSTTRVAAVRAQQPGEHAQEGGLAGAVGAEHRERLALVHAHAHAGERRPLAVAPLQPFELDGGHPGEAYGRDVASAA